MGAMILILLVLIGRGGYVAAESRWGIGAGIISCILAYVLPVLTLNLFAKAYDDKDRQSDNPKSKSSKSESKSRESSSRRTESAYESFRCGQDDMAYDSAMKRQLAFLRLLSCMMAKIANADGHIDESEIKAVERTFIRLGFDDEQRQVCMSAFRGALSSQECINVLANSFARTGFGLEIRNLVYEILWDIACADGILAAGEKTALREAAVGLNLDQGIYERFYQERVKVDSTGYDRHESNQPKRKCERELQDAYAELGCRNTDTNEELKKAYRSLVKKLHPDILRAQGMPETLMSRANERMCRINHAWELIKRNRNIH